MYSLPIKSYNILEIHTKNVSLIIKGREVKDFDTIPKSNISITAQGLEKIKISSLNIDNDYECVNNIVVPIDVPPLFFEHTNYDVIIKSKDGKCVSLNHDNQDNSFFQNASLNENKSAVKDIINFKDNIGFSDLEIMHDGKTHLIVRLEVLPFLINSKRKISSKKSDEKDTKLITIPSDIENKLSYVDWSLNDVLVGSLGSVNQLNDNIKRNYYYVPAKHLDNKSLFIRYIALFQSATMFQKQSGIRYYGEVTHMRRVKRKDINFPLRTNNGDEWYYAFRIKEWKELKETISIKNEIVLKPKYTNLFLLQNCTYSYEIFNIHSTEEYLLNYALKTILDKTILKPDTQTKYIYHINDDKSISAQKDYFNITNTNAENPFVMHLKISDFSRNPKICLNKVKEKFIE